MADINPQVQTQRQTTEAIVLAESHYSLDALNPPGFKQNLKFFVLDKLLPSGMNLLSRIAPVWRIPGTNIVFVTGFDEVQEVFSRQHDFEVPYEEQVKVLDWPYFLLALQDTAEYWSIRGNVRRLWRDGDLDRVRQIARETADRMLDEHAGSIDLIQELVKPVLLAVVERYYGVAVPDGVKQPFFDGNLAGSGFVFSGPKISAKSAANAKSAVREVWPVIDSAMQAAQRDPDTNTVLGRYYTEDFGDFPPAQMRSSVMAMIGGYLPTDTNASGRIMEVLLGNTRAMDFVTDAATRNDQPALLRGLHEALRLNYIIPILWRRAAKDTYIGEGSKKLRSVLRGRILAMSLQSAMRDGKRVAAPKQFNPDRSPDVNMMYGHNFHYCVGDQISDAILTELFQALLTRAPQRSRARRKTRWVGMYPWNLYLDYQA